MEEVIFNGRVELAIRLLFLLKHSNKDLDLQRILYYNYLMVHSSDISGGPSSLHPDLPNRSCEIIVLRENYKEAIQTLLSKGVISVKYKKNGVYYSKNKDTLNFLSYFESDYSRNIDETAKWICDYFGKENDIKISKFINSNLTKWGEEFSQVI
jgi:hypothetical protein